jgi:PTS system nitrogen regulatory IIA component
MALSEHLTAERVIFLQGSSKKDVIEEMVDAVANGAEGVGRDEISRAMWRREGLMSTGIGNGLAVPHARLNGLSKAVMVAGISRDGVEGYDALDAEPVRIVIMIAAPQGQHEAYIRLLAEVAEVLKQPELRKQVTEADSPARAYELMTSQQARQEAAR